MLICEDNLMTVSEACYLLFPGRLLAEANLLNTSKAVTLTP